MKGSRCVGRFGSVLVWPCLVLCACHQAVRPTLNLALRDELVALHQARVSCLNAHPGPVFSPECATIDLKSATRLAELVDRFGWPTIPLAGPEGSTSAFFVLQHAPQEQLALRERCLPLMEAAGARGEVELSEVALVTDRLLVHQGRPQRYGSQFFHTDAGMQPRPIEDEAHLDERRRAVGLQPFAKYRAGFEHWDDVPDAGP